MKSEWKKVTLGDLISVSQGYTFKPEFQGVQGEKWQYFKVADIGLSSNKKYLITANAENIHNLPNKETLSRIIMNTIRNVSKHLEFIFPMDNSIFCCPPGV